MAFSMGWGSFEDAAAVGAMTGAVGTAMGARVGTCSDGARVASVAPFGRLPPPSAIAAPAGCLFLLLAADFDFGFALAA